ncbi:hypothetical protein GPECTOR_30g233 [Gonium pectorale]|uniref:Serine/threonine specific protein phosphatases domain-containing protein n=1 Tax=Gonium pectorale TaxID=33097 RepID=A0A150GE64_GONPE|nr:hypothetical protein GPECTOR_30g233 [Gonium pectorale]|eukprot:KXZ48137.1 hypothetical protein GPECTOR_30g233 [Gonium pectorale]
MLDSPPTVEQAAQLCAQLRASIQEGAASLKAVLPAERLVALIKATEAALKAEPTLVELPNFQPETQVFVFGDTHGHFPDVSYIIEQLGYPSAQRIFVFNGDYVDRLFRRPPEPKRGAKRRKPSAPARGRAGGPGELTVGCLDDLRAATKGGMDPDGCGSSLLATDVLWSDPVAAPGLRENDARGVGLVFGPDVTEAFLRANGLRLIIRSHEGPDARDKRSDLPQVLQGYSYDHRTPAGNLVTVFSAPDYPQFQAPVDDDEDEEEGEEGEEEHLEGAGAGQPAAGGTAGEAGAIPADGEATEAAPAPGTAAMTAEAADPAPPPRRAPGQRYDNLAAVAVLSAPDFATPVMRTFEAVKPRPKADPYYDFAASCDSDTEAPAAGDGASGSEGPSAAGSDADMDGEEVNGPPALLAEPLLAPQIFPPSALPLSLLPTSLLPLPLASALLPALAAGLLAPAAAAAFPGVAGRVSVGEWAVWPGSLGPGAVGSVAASAAAVGTAGTAVLGVPAEALTAAAAGAAEEEEAEQRGGAQAMDVSRPAAEAGPSHASGAAGQQHQPRQQREEGGVTATAAAAAAACQEQLASSRPPELGGEPTDMATEAAETAGGGGGGAGAAAAAVEAAAGPQSPAAAEAHCNDHCGSPRPAAERGAAASPSPPPPPPQALEAAGPLAAKADGCKVVSAACADMEMSEADPGQVPHPPEAAVAVAGSELRAGCEMAEAG